MTDTEVKEYLCRYQSAEIEIDVLLERIERLRARAERITPPYGENDGGSNPNVNIDKLPILVEQIIEEEEKTGRRVAELMELQTEIQSVIARVPDATCRRLLIMRYIGGKSFESISVTLNYSHYHLTHRFHPQALVLAGKIIENDKRCTKMHLNAPVKM